jgi:hypothetical protein
MWQTLSPVSTGLGMMHGNKQIFEKILICCFSYSNFNLAYGFTAVNNQPFELRVLNLRHFQNTKQHVFILLECYAT